MLPSSSFVKIIEVKKSLNLITVTQTDALLLTPHQIAVIVTPTALFHEEVPDEYLLIVWSASMSVTLLQNLWIAHPFGNQAPDIRILDMQEPTTTPIKAHSNELMIG